MAKRNRIYICFDADTDMWAFARMKRWKTLDNMKFDFTNFHDDNTIRKGSSQQTIKAKLQERLKN